MFSRGRRLSQRQTSLRNGIKVFLLVRAGTALAMTAATAVERVIQISLVTMAVVGFLFLVAALAFDVGCSRLA